MFFRKKSEADYVLEIKSAIEKSDLSYFKKNIASIMRYDEAHEGEKLKETAILWCVSYQDMDTLQFLIKSGLDLDSNKINYPMHIFSVLSSVQDEAGFMKTDNIVGIIKALKLTDNGTKYLNSANWESIIRYSPPDALKFILDSNIDILPDNHKKTGNSVLHYLVTVAPITLEFEKKIEIVIDSGFGINDVNCNKESPIDLAIDKATVEFLKVKIIKQQKSILQSAVRKNTQSGDSIGL